jgi:hypothetical protein
MHIHSHLACIRHQVVTISLTNNRLARTATSCQRVDQNGDQHLCQNCGAAPGERPELGVGEGMNSAPSAGRGGFDLVRREVCELHGRLLSNVGHNGEAIMRGAAGFHRHC